MSLRLCVPAGSVRHAMGLGLRRRGAAPCTCPVVPGGALASKTPPVGALAALWRGFATQRAAHVKYSDKKRKLPVILLQDCTLGRAGDEVEVSPGYMRNYLYERRIAVYSTVENKREHYVPRTQQDRAGFLRPARIAAALSATPLVRAGADDAVGCSTATHSPRPARLFRSCIATSNLDSGGQRARLRPSISPRS